MADRVVHEEGVEAMKKKEIIAARGPAGLSIRIVVSPPGHVSRLSLGGRARGFSDGPLGGPFPGSAAFLSPLFDY